MITESNDDPWENLIDLCPEWYKGKDDPLGKFKAPIEKIMQTNCMLLTSFFVYPVAFTYERYNGYFAHGEKLLKERALVKDYASWVAGLSEYYKFLRAHINDLLKLAENGIVGYDLGFIVMGVEHEEIISIADKSVITNKEKIEITKSFSKCLRTARATIERLFQIYEQIDFSYFMANESELLGAGVQMSDPQLIRIYTAIEGCNELAISFFEQAFQLIEALYKTEYSAQSIILENYRKFYFDLSKERSDHLELFTKMFDSWVEFAVEILHTKIAPDSEESYTWVELVDYTASILSQIGKVDKNFQ